MACSTLNDNITKYFNEKNNTIDNRVWGHITIWNSGANVEHLQKNYGSNSYCVSIGKLSEYNGYLIGDPPLFNNLSFSKSTTYDYTSLEGVYLGSPTTRFYRPVISYKE